MCVLELADELRRLAELCAVSTEGTQKLIQERAELARKLKKHARYRTVDRRTAAKAQLVWLGEQVAAAKRQAAELGESRHRVAQELKKQMGLLTPRQRGQLMNVRRLGLAFRWPAQAL